MMLDKENVERHLMQALRHVAVELRAIDAIDLVSYIHSNRLANISDLIDGAIELYFKPGTVLFAQQAEVNVNWFGGVRVDLDLEFHGGDVSVYFRLTLTALEMHITVQHMTLSHAKNAMEIPQEVLQYALQHAARTPASHITSASFHA